MAVDESSEAAETGAEAAHQPQEPEPDAAAVELRGRVPAQIRDVTFPAAMRGYDRGAVDAYVREVNRVIAELEISRSPDAAVKHALDRVADQTRGILEQARESAEQITTTAREEADQSIAQATAEAEALVAQARAEANEIQTRSNREAEETLARSRADAAERVQQTEREVAALRAEAEARVRELQTDTETIWKERSALLDDMRGIAERLGELARTAAARMPSAEPVEPGESEQPTIAAAPPSANVPVERR